jgi:hypothetical protein
MGQKTTGAMSEVYTLYTLGGKDLCVLAGTFKKKLAVDVR